MEKSVPMKKLYASLGGMLLSALSAEPRPAAPLENVPPSGYSIQHQMSYGTTLYPLLDGVAEIAAPGVPGPLCVYGPEAPPVIVGAPREGAASVGVRAPVVAAAHWQDGRVVVLGHDGYFKGIIQRT